MESITDNLLVVGISHKSAPIEVRERVAVPQERIPEVLDQLLEHEGLDEAILLSTCNRTELYALANAAAQPLVRDWIHQIHPLAGDLEPYRYTHRGTAAARHLFRVTAGLDSMVLGESQVLGQVKQAYLDAHASSAVGPQLHQLFQFAFNTAKAIRGDTTLDAVRSLPYAAVKLAQQHMGNLKGRKAVLVGAGETMELLAFHLRAQGIGELHCANRTLEGSQALADRYQGEAHPLSALKDLLADADLLASATGSSTTLITPDLLALHQPEHPLLLLDLGLPRDMDPAMANLPGIALLSLDDLGEIIATSKEMRYAAAVEAEHTVMQSVATWHQAGRIRTVVPTICALRAAAAQARRRTLAEARRIATARGSDAALEYLARTLTNRLIHTPTVRLRNAAASEQTALVDAARELFALTDEYRDQQDQDHQAA